MGLAEIEAGAAVDRPLLIRARELKTTREGKQYLRLELADRTQALPAMVWDVDNEMAQSLVAGSVVGVNGRVEEHAKFGRQLQVSKLQKVDPETVDMSALIPGPSVPVDQLEERFWQLIERVKDETANLLLKEVFAQNGSLWSRFRLAPAAKFFHEAYRHGLLDHTLAVAESVELLASRYSEINADVAIAGALLHDIGKALSYTDDPLAPEFTDIGRLEGHIVIGYELVRQAQERLSGLNNQTVRLIRHIVLSHHGKLEHGSPVVPLTREAVLVHQADDFAARMGGFDRLERGLAPGEQWTGFDRSVGGQAYFPAGGSTVESCVDPAVDTITASAFSAQNSQLDLSFAEKAAGLGKSFGKSEAAQKTGDLQAFY